jgi:Uma2 family endonuclease
MLDAMFDPSLLGSQRVRPLRREEFDRLVELGCFVDERVQLIEGVLVEMTPPGAPHSFGVGYLTELLVKAVGERAMVRCQLPLALGDTSEPQPDIAVIPRAVYWRAHPADAFLVVEVADSSLRFDRIVKARVYARARIPEYWIVNVNDRLVEVYRDPVDESYASVSAYRPGELLHLRAFPDIAVPVVEIVPPP